MTPRVWVYARVYVHDRPEMLDWLVIAALPRIRERLGGARWFYLRYFDETGTHLRVRFEVPAAEADIARNMLADELTVPYARLDREGFGGFGWFLPLVHPPRMPGRVQTDVVMDTYVPEHGTYGDAEMTVAEDLFHRSSELATAELQDRRVAGAAYAKSAALGYMEAVRETFAPHANEEAFWTDYREFWLGPNVAGAEKWRTLFVRQAERALAAGSIAPAPSPRVDAWRGALRDAAARYGGRARALAVRPFIHLTNNRLGITYLEESYLAQLLLSARAVAS
ncbi:MAG: hypothetical protein QOD51_1130 [Candidatus Eremiobacteraeota bacterium]|nr:hypothetical protein [Candidatus Eremiobacteraeota bacterium]